jgi:hypothetical protein
LTSVVLGVLLQPIEDKQSTNAKNNVVFFIFSSPIKL